MASYAQRWPPPFQGAPPIPAGVNVPQNHWNSGVWMLNPNYNPQAARPANSSWMPGQAWGSFYGQQQHYHHPQQQQQQQQHNPYKRQPRPPSAEYLATKLVENPLGLHDMVPAEEVERRRRESERKKQEQEAVTAPTEVQASTPWIWTPRPLDGDDNASNHLPATNAHPDSNAIYSAQPIPDRPGSTQAPESFTSKAALQPTFSVNIVRTPNHYASPSPSRASHRATAPAQIYASPARDPAEGITSQMNHLSTTSPPKPLTRHQSMPNPTYITSERLTDEPGSISDVLSPLVIPMTPKQASSRSNLGRHSSVPAVASTSLDTIPETSSATSPGAAPSRSHTPAPSSHRNSHQESLQSPPPPYSHSHSRSTSRPSSRHGSRPGSNSTSPYSVPHSSEPSPVSPTYPHSQGHSPHNPHFPYSTQLKNPLPAPPAEVAFPSLSQIPSSSTNNSTPASSSTSSSGSGGGGYNIYLPATAPPPAPHRTRSYSSTSGTAILHSHGSSTITTITSSPQHSPTSASQHLDRSFSPKPRHPQHQHQQHQQHHHHAPPSTPTPTPERESRKKRTSTSSSSKHPKKRRKGFWNRRGDHVTQEGYVVYAPHDMVYPPDLDEYPDGKDGGYMNEMGYMTKWAVRPALNPEGGYESIIQWV